MIRSTSLTPPSVNVKTSEAVEPVRAVGERVIGSCAYSMALSRASVVGSPSHRTASAYELSPTSTWPQPYTVSSTPCTQTYASWSAGTGASSSPVTVAVATPAGRRSDAIGNSSGAPVLTPRNVCAQPATGAITVTA